MPPSNTERSEPLPQDPRDNWAALDATQRDAAYNNNAAVPDSATWIEKRDHDSAAHRAAHPGHLDLAYGTGERTAFDLYPAATPHSPCLVFIHGGYWQRNSRELFACIAEGPAAIGWSVAIPGYTLAPQANMGTIVAEIGQALDWLADRGPDHGIAGPLIIAGWSAGAQLAALHLSHRRVLAGLAISGIYELAPLRDTNLNQALNLSDSDIAEFSPLRRDVVQKPLIVSVGSAELPTLVHDAWNFYEFRSRRGAPGRLLSVAGADHFSILQELQKPDGALLRAALELAENP
jgi:arylformamidase